MFTFFRNKNSFHAIFDYVINYINITLSQHIKGLPAQIISQTLAEYVDDANGAFCR